MRRMHGFSASLCLWCRRSYIVLSHKMHVTCYSPSKKCRLFLSPQAKEPVLIYHLGESVRGRGNGVRISRLLRDKGEILERKGIERLILRSSGPIFAPKWWGKFLISFFPIWKMTCSFSPSGPSCDLSLASLASTAVLREETGNRSCFPESVTLSNPNRINRNDNHRKMSERNKEEDWWLENGGGVLFRFGKQHTC